MIIDDVKYTLINHFTTFSLTIIVLIGAFFRINNLASKSLWMDEIGQVLVASSGSVLDVIDKSQFHLSPPLDYIILHYFLYLGDSDFIVRLPAAIFGILSIILIYKVGKILFSEKEGLVCAFLLSISPMAIWFSQEARMYSLFMFLSLLSLLFFIKILQVREVNIGWWFGFIFSTVLLLYTHYFALFILLNEVLFFILITFKSRYLNKDEGLSTNINKIKILYFFFCVIIISEFFILYINIFLFQTIGLQRVLKYGMLPNASFFTSILTSVSHNLSVGGLLEILLYLLFLIPFTFGIIVFNKKYKDQISLLFLWILMPVVASFFLTYFRGPMTTTRNMIFILPPFIILISRGLINISNLISKLINGLNSRSYMQGVVRNQSLIIIFMLMVVFFIVNVGSVVYGYSVPKGDMRGTADYLTENVDSDNLIVTFGDSTNHLGYYYDGKNVEIISYNRRIPSVDFINFALCHYEKIWFVSSPQTGTDIDILEWLDSNCKLERSATGLGNGREGAIYTVNGNCFNNSINKTEYLMECKNKSDCLRISRIG